MVCLGTHWRPAVVRVHDRAQVRVTAHTSSGRAAAACGGHQQSKAGASGGGTRDSEGSPTPRLGGGASVGRRVPDPSSLTSPGGNHPGLAVSSRITRCCGPVSSGRTPPVQAGCASTADSDEGSGTTPPVGRIPASWTRPRHGRACAHPSGPCPQHRPGLSGEPGTQATTSNDRRPTARPSSPGARPLAAQASPEAWCPPNAAAGRPRDVCTVTRTGARSWTRTPPAANASPGTPPNCVTQRGHQTLGEAVKSS
ncbi:hypothetical protein ABH920_008415 [Catenulispora sp. EB89]